MSSAAPAAAVNAIPAAVWREVLRYLSSPEGVASAITEEAAVAALEELYRCHRVNQGTAPDPSWDWGMSLVITGQLGKLIGAQESVRNARPHRLSPPAPAPTPWLSRASVEAAADSVDAQRKRGRRAAMEREEAEECRREHEREAASECRRARRRDMEVGRRLNDPNDPIAIAAERDRLESIKESVRRSKERDLKRELEAAGIVAPSFGDMLGPDSTRLTKEYEERKAAYLAAKAAAAPAPAPAPAPAAAAPAPEEYPGLVPLKYLRVVPTQAEQQARHERRVKAAQAQAQEERHAARRARVAASEAAAPAPAPAPGPWAAWPHGVTAAGVPLPPPPPAPPAYVPRERVEVDLTQSDDEVIVVK